jgi:hypothetical protein
MGPGQPVRGPVLLFTICEFKNNCLNIVLGGLFIEQPLILSLMPIFFNITIYDLEEKFAFSFNTEDYAFNRFVSSPLSWNIKSSGKHLRFRLTLHFSTAFVARRRRRLWIQGAAGSFPASATEGPAGILDSMSRSPTERNDVESWREMQG